MDKVRELFSLIEAAYDDVASKYGFTCEGCEENCCVSRFHHHTFAEYYYLLEGLRSAEPALREEIISRSREAVSEYEKSEETGEFPPVMCPVNVNGLCGLREHRPIICRLHGMPHVFRMPTGELVTGLPCGKFQRLFTEYDYKIDRTPFYRALAEIERGLRQEHKLAGRYKKTTAHMILDMTKEL